MGFLWTVGSRLWDFLQINFWIALEGRIRTSGWKLHGGGFCLLEFYWGFLHLCSSVILACSILTLHKFHTYVFSSAQSLNHVRLLATPWIAARQASLSNTNSQSSLRLTSIESVMPSSHLILGHPLLLLPPISPSIRVFSSESTLRMRCPKYWSFSFSIIPSKEIPGLISFRMHWLDLLAI